MIYHQPILRTPRRFTPIPMGPAKSVRFFPAVAVMDKRRSLFFSAIGIGDMARPKAFPAIGIGRAPAAFKFFPLIGGLPEKQVYEIGQIIMSILEDVNPLPPFNVIPRNPHVWLGYGTWEIWLTGQVPVGVDPDDTVDYDFDTVEKSGGLKRHKHQIDVPETGTSGAGLFDVEEVDNDKTLSTVNVPATNHGHTVNPAVFDSEEVDHLMPYKTCYFWKRTA